MVQSAPQPIRARGLVKSYGDVSAVAGLDLEVAAGTCLALLGPNGAGKTTTIEMLEGLVEPDAGTIELLGLSWRSAAAGIRRRIGVQLQESRLPEKLRVFEVLRLFASLYPKSAPLAEVLATVGLEEKRTAFVGALSGGQRQRLSLGCAIVHRPEILFLDEPTTGLDPQGRRRVWEVVERFKERGGTVLLSTHFMEEAERLADELLIVDHGRAIARGTPGAVVASLEADTILDLSVAPANGHAGPPSLPAERLRALPEVSSVRETDGRLRIGARSVERVLPEVLRALAERELVLAELSVHRPSLEDVFVSLTGRGLREG